MTHASGTPKYHRVLLKLSGEALLGDRKFGISPQYTAYLSEEIRKGREKASALLPSVAEEGPVRARAFHFLDAQSARRVGLWIEVDDQNAFADRGKAGGEIDRGGCLAHATLLIGDSDGFDSHAMIK